MEETRSRKLHRLLDAALLLLIAGFAFWVNRGIRIRGLYMDDLYMWSCYGEQSIWEFAFPIGTSTRFRPVYWLATYLQMMIVGNRVAWFVPFNIVCNAALAWMIFFMAKDLSGCRWAGALSAVCWLASRFAYYQIGQALGLMETMAQAMALLILWMLLKYMTSPPPAVPRYSRGREARDKMNGLLVGAVVVWFLLAFTHERYISLFPLFYYALAVRLMQQPKGDRRHMFRRQATLWAVPALFLTAVVLIRAFCIGKALPAGTGGTEVTETFRLSECLRFCLSQVLYLFGVNDGPEHLNGLPWADTPPEIKRMTKYSVLLIGLICIAFALLVLKEIITALRGKTDPEEMRESEGAQGVLRAQSPLVRHITVSLLFLLFIALCIGCSSVTIRVEMRWIYVSFAAALLFACWMIGEVCDAFSGNFAVRVLLTLLFAGYVFLSVRCNIFYRGYFDRLYFWPNQLRMNSLAEQTVERYGTEGIFGKDIYILENTYEMTDFYARTFFKPYDPAKKAEGTRVLFVKDVQEIPAADVLEGRALVLREVPEDNAYRDITEELKLKLAGEMS